MQKSKQKYRHKNCLNNHYNFLTSKEEKSVIVHLDSKSICMICAIFSNVNISDHRAERFPTPSD